MILLTESCEAVTKDYLAGKWTTWGDTKYMTRPFGPDVSYGRHGKGICLTSGLGTVYRYLRKTVSARPRFGQAGAFKWAHGAFGGPFMELMDGGTKQAQLSVHTDGTLRVIKSGTAAVQFSTSFSLNLDTYHHIAWDCEISHNARVRVWVDGIQRMDETGLDTQSTGNATANQISYYGADGSAGPYVDDLYAYDDQAPNNQYMGDIRMFCSVPVADGDRSEGTPSAGSDHFAMVDDLPADGDTSYIALDVATLAELFEMEDVNVLGDFKAMALYVLGRKDDAGTCTVVPMIKLNGTEYEGDESAWQTTYSWAGKIWQVNPETGLAFIAGDVNGLQAGFKRPQ